MERTTTLDDRETATLIDALAMTRDAIIAKGLTGADCKSALAKINALMTPTTAGLRITAIDATADS